MDKKTTGIIATVAAVLLCGCPGLCGLFFGVISAIASFIPGSEIDVFGSNDPQAALYTGIGFACGGIAFHCRPGGGRCSDAAQETCESRCIRRTAAASSITTIL